MAPSSSAIPAGADPSGGISSAIRAEGFDTAARVLANHADFARLERDVNRYAARALVDGLVLRLLAFFMIAGGAARIQRGGHQQSRDHRADCAFHRDLPALDTLGLLRNPARILPGTVTHRPRTNCRPINHLSRVPACHPGVAATEPCPPTQDRKGGRPGSDGRQTRLAAHRSSIRLTIRASHMSRPAHRFA